MIDSVTARPVHQSLLQPYLCANVQHITHATLKLKKSCVEHAFTRTSPYKIENSMDYNPKAMDTASSKPSFLGQGIVRVISKERN